MGEIYRARDTRLDRVVRTNFRAEFAPRFAASDEHLLWIRGEALVAQPFDPAKLRLHGEVAEVSNVVGTGALGFAHFSVHPTECRFMQSGNLANATSSGGIGAAPRQRP